MTSYVKELFVDLINLFANANFFQVFKTDGTVKIAKIPTVLNTLQSNT